MIEKMTILFFVLSLTAVIHFFIKIISCICGNSIKVPCPILHIFDCSYSNAYISTPAIMYQVYFWANYAGLFAS